MAVSADGANAYNNVTESSARHQDNECPPPPKLQKVSLSSDGTKMLISFNRPTDKAETSVVNYLSTFACSEMLDFNASDSSTCNFFNASYLIATFPSSTSIMRVTGWRDSNCFGQEDKVGVHRGRGRDSVSV